MNTQTYKNISWNRVNVCLIQNWPKFVALTPNAWNCPNVSIPGQGDLQAPMCDISRDNWELWKLRPGKRNLTSQYCVLCSGPTLSSEISAWDLFQLTEVLVILSIRATNQPSLCVGDGALTTLSHRSRSRQVIVHVQLLPAHPGAAGAAGQPPALPARAPGPRVPIAPEEGVRMIQC